MNEWEPGKVVMPMQKANEMKSDTSMVDHDWTESVIMCQYERYGGKAFTSAPVSAGLAAFSEGFWVDERGHYSSTESVEWVAPERILVIFRERGGRPRISSNVLMIDRSPTEVG